MTRWRAAIFGIALLVGPGESSGQTATAVRQALLTPRGFLGFGTTHFLASKTFEAIFGDARGSTWLAGGQLVLRGGVFVEIALERFERTGQRVFVFDGTVMPLGVPDTVTITPLVAIAGLRFRQERRVVPYIGAGIGSYAFREESAFADATDDVESRHAGYLFLAGAEFRVVRLLGVAGELQFATVPGALGEGGVSGEYGETNLGGRTLRVKLVIGR